MGGDARRTSSLLTIRAEATVIATDSALVPRSAGMVVTMQIKTGRRWMLDYLFLALGEVALQSVHER